MDDVKKAEFAQIENSSPEQAQAKDSITREKIEKILDVTLGATVELGNTKMTLEKALNVDVGTVIELDKVAGEPVDFYINENLFARGEVVVIGEKYGVRITELAAGAPIKAGKL
jgi:flagellar motor switch protein FliN/FliY